MLRIGKSLKYIGGQRLGFGFVSRMQKIFQLVCDNFKNMYFFGLELQQLTACPLGWAV